MRARLAGPGAAVALMLAACAGEAPPAKVHPTVEDMSSASTGAPPSATPATQSARRQSDAHDSRGPVPPIAMAAPTAPLAAGRLANPGSLIGLETDQVRALLGRPGLLRRDPPAEVWQYASSTCILDLFLYENGATMRVAHVETRGPSVLKVAWKTCYESLFPATGGSG